MSAPEYSRKAAPPFSTLRAFEAVGRLGGIRRAAISLGLDHAVVSRHVRSLEEWAGIALINRQRVGQVLTAEGQAFHRRISQALVEISNASAELLNAANTGSLNIWCMPGLAFAWLTPTLPRWRSRFPGIELELRPTAEQPDFKGYEADVAIRYVTGDAPATAKPIHDGARQQELARPPVFPVANPQVAARLGRITDIAQLLDAPLLHEESAAHWLSWFSACGVQCPPNLSGPRLWYGHVAVEAARRGQGVALANPLLLANELREGQLVPLLDPQVFGPVTLGAYVFFARADRWNRPAVAQFRRWLASEMSAVLGKPGETREIPPFFSSTAGPS